jgi:hypothetical protein
MKKFLARKKDYLLNKHFYMKIATAEDRAGLFFYLVKEIYDLPMIVVEYPKHVTIAIKFNKPYGNTITYNGIKYSICEPSSQREDLRIGEMLPSLRHTSFDVPYAYTPKNK